LKDLLSEKISLVNIMRHDVKDGGWSKWGGYPPPPLPTDLVIPTVFQDDLPRQKSDIAICTIPANKIAMEQLNVTRRNILNYADRCGADYIELSGDQSPEWPMSNKYRVSQVTEKYENTLYLDCDIVVKDNTPDVFKTLGKERISFVDEWDIIKQSYNLIFESIKRERKEILEQYPNLQKNNRSIQPNGGVMLIPKKLSHRYHQPKLPYPKRWCFDQNYLLINLEDNEFDILNWKYNLEFIDFDFWSKIEDCYFIHANGSRPASYRLELLQRLVDKDYSFFRHLEPNENEYGRERFRPIWRKNAD